MLASFNQLCSSTYEVQITARLIEGSTRKIPNASPKGATFCINFNQIASNSFVRFGWVQQERTVKVCTHFRLYAHIVMQNIGFRRATIGCMKYSATVVSSL